MNVPNMLIVGWVAAIPFIIGLLYVPHAWITQGMAQHIATALFVAAAVTDWLDGYLARKLNQPSSFGAWLDPVADKLLISACLIVLVHMGRMHAAIAIVIVAREIAVSALRERMAQIGESSSVAVAFVGKLKTTCQMLAIPFLIEDIRWGGGWGTQDAGTVLIWLAMGLTVWSMAHYVKSAIGIMLEHDRQAPGKAAQARMGMGQMLK